MLFKGEYSFRGSHAEKVIQLTAEFDDVKHKLFHYNYSVYLLAPIVGFLYGKKSEMSKGSESTKIFAGQLSPIEDELWFNYRLIVLLDKDNEPDFDLRIDKAFRYYGQEQAKPDEELYEDYVRGGVDILYEKLIEKSHDYLKNLYEFMEEFEGLYGQNTDEILDLVKLAKG